MGLWSKWKVINQLRIYVYLVKTSFRARHSLWNNKENFLRVKKEKNIDFFRMNKTVERWTRMHSKRVRILLRTYRIHFVTGDASGGASQLHGLHRTQRGVACREKPRNTHAPNVTRMRARTYVRICTRACIFMVTIRITIRISVNEGERVREGAGRPLFERGDGTRGEKRRGFPASDKGRL